MSHTIFDFPIDSLPCNIDSSGNLPHKRQPWNLFFKAVFYYCYKVAQLFLFSQ